MSDGAPYKQNTAALPQKVNYGATAATSVTAFGTQTYIVRLIASTDCYIKFGKSDVAVDVSNGMFIKANWTPEYFFCTPGQYIAAIRDSADGTLYITEMTR